MMKLQLFSQYPKKYDSLLTLPIREQHKLSDRLLKAVWNVLFQIDRRPDYIPDEVLNNSLKLDHVLANGIMVENINDMVKAFLYHYLDYRLANYEKYNGYLDKGLDQTDLESIIEMLVRIGGISVSCLNRHYGDDVKDISGYFRRPN